jgi:hypothetical protein
MAFNLRNHSFLQGAHVTYLDPSGARLVVLR